ncbi:hypothetical protein K443DRAFT_674256 [Laccaria amethystina LaAM-08-1]|uniref:Chord-domain-containing protein n=1 Tax=Laccaria amethystina LaAM-08-1 TaxID=1095629 RepID=A0A0C9XY82_9AGAR|nr:hypothetical protein K443DRAFT_674256 [Laccaria amethystina LaAM-08-1]
MSRCTRKGCGKDFTSTSTDKCIFHPGEPVFHEGLKSWSCCKDVNKPVLDFDEFMNLPGCTETDFHTSATPQAESAAKPPSAANLTTIEKTVDGVETYGTTLQQSIAPASAPVAVPIVEEEDDLTIQVSVGTHCRRKGCGTTFVSDEINRIGDEDGAVCIYHPAPPIFREGSKGYLCCKRRVLEFDEFLKIKGCKKGRHLFSPPPELKTEELVTCRVDHYQTLERVHVSIFAKQVDKDRSIVQFCDSEVTLDLFLPGSKRFKHTLNLFGPIDPTRSHFSVFGTKVELHLQKSDTRSWTILEKTNRDLGNVSLTFGVGGRTGTVGAKDIVLDPSNGARALNPSA